MDVNDENFLRETTSALGAARRLQRDRDDRIASLIRYRRATVAELMGATGLTKSRIYQIFETKYGFAVSEIDVKG
jgi:hypothetical protein